MKKFPKFLKAMPTFWGLGFSELGSVMAILYMAMIFNLGPLTTFILALVMVILTKVVNKYFDLTGWFLPRKREVFITDFKKVNHDSSL